MAHYRPPAWLQQGQRLPQQQQGQGQQRQQEPRAALRTDTLRLHAQDAISYARVSTTHEARFDLERALPDVVSVEVEEAYIPVSIAPTFFTKTESQRGNNLLDMRVFEASGAWSVDFTVELEVLDDYPNPAAMRAAVQEQINAVFDLYRPGSVAKEDSTITVFTYDIGVAPLPYTAVSIGYAATGEPNTDLRVHFLFGSGPNSGHGPERIFGYVPEQDTQPHQIPADSVEFLEQEKDWTGPIAPYPGRVREARYVDVFIPEMEERLGQATPSARVILPALAPIHVANWKQSVRPRFLTQPIRSMRRLSVRLKPPRGMRLVADRAHDNWYVDLRITRIVAVPSGVSSTTETALFGTGAATTQLV